MIIITICDIKKNHTYYYAQNVCGGLLPPILPHSYVEILTMM